MEYYYSFKKYLKNLHNKKIWRVTLSTGYPCPNRIDGNGCSFCDGKSFIADYMNNNSIKKQLEEGIIFFGKKFEVEYFYGYFQDNTGTYGDLDDLSDKYESVLQHDKILGLIISTRPDFIHSDILNKIVQLQKKYNKDIWIETGLQSVYNKTLNIINRNHTYHDFKKSVKMINDTGVIKSGVHMIIGLPQETPDMILEGFKKLFKENDIQGLKIRILDILPGTQIEKMYMSNPEYFYKFSNCDYIKLISSILENIPEDTVILRTINYNPINIIHNSNELLRKDQMLNEIRNELKKRKTRQGYYFIKEVPN